MNSDRFVKIEMEGRTYSATYQVRGRLVTVRTAHGPQKSTNIGSNPPEVIAQSLLRELVREEKARPDPME